MTALLQVKGLTKSWGGIRAVHDVSFSLGKGKILAMIGPNGAGKSTCFSMLNGQIRPDSGTIHLNGRNISGLPPSAIYHLGVGRTFQVARTFLSMTVRENVQVALLSFYRNAFRFLGFTGNFKRNNADTLLSLVGLLEQGDRPCSKLAYGDLKRLELAIALSNSPQLLLMDEPMAGMGTQESAELMRLIITIAREQDIGILFTEHDLDVVFANADAVMVLDQGQCIACDAPDAIRKDPRVKEIYTDETMISATDHSIGK